MFRDTLSVSWSYSCYIVCCWLAINILIVLAFFSFTALSSTRVGFTQVNPASFMPVGLPKALEKSDIIRFIILTFKHQEILRYVKILQRHSLKAHVSQEILNWHSLRHSHSADF